MIAVDTNLLVYAHRSATAEHRAARRAIEDACADSRGWGISLPCLAEFWSIATHPASSGRPSSPREVAAFIRSLIDDGAAQIWMPGPGFGERLMQLGTDLPISGPHIFDLQIALIAFENGAREIWTHDSHFRSMPGLRIRDPLA